MFAPRTLGLFAAVASASMAMAVPGLATPKAANWYKVGPSNIGDDIHQNGACFMAAALPVRTAAVFFLG